MKLSTKNNEEMDLLVELLDYQNRALHDIPQGTHAAWILEPEQRGAELPGHFIHTGSACRSTNHGFSNAPHNPPNAEEICLLNGSPNALHAAQNIRAICEAHGQCSSHSPCVVLDMTWIFEIGAGSDLISDFLRQLQTRLRGDLVSVIYRFERQLFKASWLLDLLSFFPVLALDLKLYQNPYFIPAPDFQSGDSQSAALTAALDRVRALGGVEETLSRRSEELRRSESALRMLESIMDSMGAGVFVVDERGNMIFCNKSSESILGYGLLNIPLNQRVNIIGNYLPDMVTPYPTNELPVARAIRGESSDGVEIFIKNDRRPSGVWISTTVRPLRDRDGTLRGGVIVFRDVSAQKAEAAEREKLEEQMFRTQKLESLGVLAGGIAHDYNNLLMGVLGNADLALVELQPNSPIHRRISHIGTAARRLAELTNQLLAYSGKGSLLDQKLDLASLVQEMAELLGPAISKKAKVHFDFQADLPAIEADPAQIRQVVMNLLTNASDALGEQPGTITVRTHSVFGTKELLAQSYLLDHLQERAYVVLEVQDTGCGMDKETIAKIFDPFFTTKFTGRGLGLAAVLGIIRRHQGTVQVESTPGEGTLFRVMFPALDPMPAANPEPKLLQPITQLGSGTVLIVDDEETVRDVASDMLRVLGFETLKAASGSEALSIFRKRRDEIRCVLLDLTMPDMNGEDIFAAMKDLSAEVKIILSSGYHEVDSVRRFSEEDISAFLQKPYGSEALIGALQKLGS